MNARETLSMVCRHGADRRSLVNVNDTIMFWISDSRCMLQASAREPQLPHVRSRAEEAALEPWELFEIVEAATRAVDIFRRGLLGEANLKQTFSFRNFTRRNGKGRPPGESR